MRPWMIGVFMAGLSVAFAELAWTEGGALWVLAWPAASALCVAAAYFAQRPSWLGKRDDGERALWAWILYAPYFTFVLAAWRMQQWLGEDVGNEVVPGIHVGRRAHGQELPPGLARVVDLTAEFGEPDEVRGLPGWRCLRTLDASTPPARAFAELADELAAVEGPLWIHCASGHGRSAALAAAIIIRRGLAPDAASAERLMRVARPGVGLRRVQRALVDATRPRRA